MKNVVLVTGGAGYIGSHICKALAGHGFVPLTYDNLCSGHAAAVRWGPLVRGDICDHARLAETLSKYNPSAIIHCAALMQVGDSVINPAVFYENNVQGSLCLLEEARRGGIKHIVFSSTAAVYGTPESGSLKENAHLKPVNPYGHTKLAVENMIRDYAGAYGMNYAILRYFNAAGADSAGETGSAYKRDTHLIPLLMQVAIGGRASIKIFGNDYDTPDGTAIRDYIHVSDLARAHVQALAHIMKGKESLTLNLGTNQGHSVEDVVRTARRVTGATIPALYCSRRAGDPPVLVADACLAKKVLGWKPCHSSLENIIATAWRWKQMQTRPLTSPAQSKKAA